MKQISRVGDLAMRLHGYLRSSATWQIRVALSLKGVAAAERLHRPDDDAAELPPHAPIETVGMLPALELPDGTLLTHSFAILEWLEEIWPSPPLLPPDPLTRQRVRAFALTVGCEIQPLHTTPARARLRAAGLSEGQAQGWTRQMATERLDACETMLRGSAGPFCFGKVPSLADVCLVPQLEAARWLGVHLAFPRLLAAEAACMTLPAFRHTHPELLHAG